MTLFDIVMIVWMTVGLIGMITGCILDWLQSHSIRELISNLVMIPIGTILGPMALTIAVFGIMDYIYDTNNLNS